MTDEQREELHRRVAVMSHYLTGGKIEAAWTDLGLARSWILYDPNDKKGLTLSWNWGVADYRIYKEPTKIKVALYKSEEGDYWPVDMETYQRRQKFRNELIHLVSDWVEIEVKEK